MPRVNFYLKRPDGDPARSLVYLQFKYHGNKLVYSFGQKIDPKNWNSKAQRVKSNKLTTVDGQYALNDLLEALARACLKGYTNELVKGIPTKECLKSYLDQVLHQNEQAAKPDLMSLFDRFISGEIKNKGKDKSRNTLQNYSTVKGHIIKFATFQKAPVTFDSIGIDFLYRFTSFLKKDLRKEKGFRDNDLPSTKGLKQNTIAKDITVIKTVMGEAVDLGYTTNMQFKHKKFTSPEEPADAVYLTEKEVLKLYRHDLTENKKLEQVRDLFVVGCFTGLRYSDYSNIQPENIVDTDGDLFIKMITQKTKELVIIPCNPVVLSIFDRYECNANRLPAAISSQKFNDYIKVAARTAGLLEKGRLSTDPSKELWENISSHTARRSFATNLYLEGFPSHELMKITGHRTESSFKKYIKVTKIETAKRLSDHIKKNWSGKLLKVAS
ncbi:tyrosine-type recombinase/integrase [Flavitalea sp.]|nr:tyrosine-type recombinase/integrase [Flavitalea sp.]